MNIFNFLFSILENVITNTDLINDLQSIEGLAYILETLGQGASSNIQYLQVLGMFIAGINTLQSFVLSPYATGTASSSLHT